MVLSGFSYLCGSISDDTIIGRGPPPALGQILMQMGHRFSADIDEYFADQTRPVLALGGTYPVSHHVMPHRHRRSQLFCPLSGVAIASTSQGAWAVPAGRGLWIPAGVRHDLRMQGTVKMQSLYFEPNTLPPMPDYCQVVAISPLMHSLMAEAVALPVL